MNQLNSLKYVDHLIGCINEECGEVVQTVGKIMRFGKKNENLEDFHREIIDLKAVIDEYLIVRGITSESECEAKINKVNKYFQILSD